MNLLVNILHGGKFTLQPDSIPLRDHLVRINRTGDSQHAATTMFLPDFFAENIA